jgi:hypothetical protein
LIPEAMEVYAELLRNPEKNLMRLEKETLGRTLEFPPKPS